MWRVVVGRIVSTRIVSFVEDFVGVVRLMAFGCNPLARPLRLESLGYIVTLKSHIVWCGCSALPIMTVFV